jgi:sugar phosphate isomerase/epimerase
MTEQQQKHGNQAGPLDLPFGIQLYMVNDDMLKDTPAVLQQIAAIGYTEVETAGLGSLTTAAEFRRALDDYGLRCPSAHLQFDCNHLQKAFDDACTLGCTYATASVPRMLLMPPVESPFSMTPEEFQALVRKILSPISADEFKRSAELMNTVGAAAKKAGLRFAAHNHTMELAEFEGQTGLDYMIAHTDPELVDFELDCGWMVASGYKPSDYFRRYPGRIKMLHVKDFLPFNHVAKPAFGTIDGMELGGGVIDQAGIFAEAEGVGIEHIFVEQDAPFSRMSALEAAKVDLEYLRSLV